MKHLLLALCVAVGLSACGTLGQVDTVAEKLSAAEASFTAAVEAATKAYKEGLIEPGSDLEKAINLAIEGGNTALETAQEFYKEGKPETALDWIDRARAATSDLEELISATKGVVSELEWRMAA